MLLLTPRLTLTHLKFKCYFSSSCCRLWFVDLTPLPPSLFCVSRPKQCHPGGFRSQDPEEPKSITAILPSVPGDLGVGRGSLLEVSEKDFSILAKRRCLLPLGTDSIVWKNRGCSSPPGAQLPVRKAGELRDTAQVLP